MGFLTDMFTGAAETRSVIPGFCRQLTWGIDATHGEGQFELHFHGGEFGLRRLLVLSDDKLTTFFLPSSADISDGKVLASMGFLLLMRNKELAMGSWQAKESRSGNVGLSVRYVALTSGLEAVTFGAICKGICDEVNAVDKYMRNKGIL